MSHSAGVEAILERLVAQFASPYDFLRELVQNAMDAGSDRVEVVLETHVVDGDEVVFELIVADTGEGMDETIIDGELTRLFASSKTDDRTMAGGFGIGFVSVFAWEPELVLLQTGRAGEAWELVFHGDRSFEKVAVGDPIEGTTLHLYRRGIAAERSAIAEAVRDSLWRWARFCPLEVTFEDVEGGEPPELIQDSPLEHMTEDTDTLAEIHERGDTTVRVAFGIPADVVFLRRGLVLAEGTPAQLLGGVGSTLGSSTEHLRVWADSPLLRTTLARDKVVEDAGRDAVEAQVVRLVEELRTRLVERLEVLAAADGQWTPRRRELYASLHAHLALERAHFGRSLAARKLLRDLSGARAWSLDSLRERAVWRVVCTRAAADDDDLVALAGRARIPVLADGGGAQTWLVPLAREIDFEVLALSEAVTRVEAGGEDGAALCELVERMLYGCGLRGCNVRAGRFTDAPGSLLAVGLLDDGALAIHGGELPVQHVAGRDLWLGRDHPLWLAAIRVHATSPLLAATATALAVAGRLGGDAPEPAALARAVDELRVP